MANEQLSLNFNFNPVLNIQKFNAILQELKNSMGKAGGDIKLIDEAKVTAAFKKIDEEAKAAGKGIEENVTNPVKKVPAKIKPSLDEAGNLFSKLGLNIKGIFSTALGVFGGGALMGGVQGLIGSFHGVLDAGKELYQETANWRIALSQAGVPAGELSEKIEQTSERVGELANKFGVNREKLEEFSRYAAGVGGATGKTNEEMVKLGLAVETASQGMVSGETAIRVFTKGVTDPETAFAMDRLKLRFPALKSALDGIKDPAKAAQAAMAYFGPTFAQMEVNAQGPIGSFTRMENSLKEFKKQAGAALIGLLQPFISFATGSLIPILQNAATWVRHLTESLKPLEPVMKVVGIAVVGVSAAIATMKAVQGAASFFGTMTKDAISYAGNLISKVIPSLATVTVAEGVAGTAGAAAGTAVSIAWGPVIGILAGIVAAGAAIYLFFTKTETGQKVFENLKNTAKQLWDTLVSGFKLIWTTIKPIWDQFVWFGGFIVDTLWNGLKQIGQAIMDAFGFGGNTNFGIMDFVKSLFKAFSEFLKPLVNIATFMYDVFAVVFKVVIIGIVEYVKLSISIYKYLWELLKTFANWVSGVFMKIWEGVSSFFTKTYNSWVSIYTYVKNLIVNIAKSLGIFDAIKKYFNNFYNVIKSVFDTIGGWVSWIINKVNSFLGKKQEKKVEIKTEEKTEVSEEPVKNEKKITDEKTKQKKEEQTAYEIAKQKYQMIIEETKSASEMQKLQNELINKRLGIQLSEIQNQQNNLKEAQNNTNAIQNQITAFKKAYDIAKKQYDLEKSRGEASKKTTENYQDAVKTMDDLKKSFLQSQISELDIGFKLKSDQTKNQEEISKLQKDYDTKSLELKVKLKIAKESDLTQLNIDQLRQEQNKLQLELDANRLGISTNYDEKSFKETRNKLIEVQGQINDLLLKLSKQVDDERIAAITNSSEREKEISLKKAQEAYKERIELARGNQREELQAWIELQNEKYKAEQTFMLKSSSVWEQNVMSFTDAFKTSMSEMSLTVDDTAQKESIKKIDDEEKAMNKSLANRTTAYEDYLSKLNDMDKQRADQMIDINKQVYEQIKKSLISSLDSTIKTQLTNLSSLATTYTALVNTRVSNDTRLTQLQKENDAMQSSSTIEYGKNVEEMSKLMSQNVDNTKASQEIIGSIYTQTGTLVGATFAKIAIESGYMVRATTMAMLEGLKAMVPMFVVQIMGAELSKLSFGGLVTAGILSGFLYSALAVAEAAASRLNFKDGVVRFRGRGTRTSDSNAVNISDEESIITARGTNSNMKELKFINNTGLNALNYYVKEEPWKIKEAFYQIAEARDLVKMMPVIQIMMNDRQMNGNSEMKQMREDNKKLHDKIDKLTKVIENSSISRREFQEVDLNVTFNDEELLSRADRKRLQSLRRS